MPWEILFSWGVIVRLFKAWSVLARCTSHKQVVTQAVKHIHVKRIHAKRIQYEVHAVQCSVHSCAFWQSKLSLLFVRFMRFRKDPSVLARPWHHQPGSGVFCSFMCLCQSVRIWYVRLNWYYVFEFSSYSLRSTQCLLETFPFPLSDVELLAEHQ